MMQVIIISPRNKSHRHFHVSKKLIAAALVFFIGVGYSLVNWGKQTTLSTSPIHHASTGTINNIANVSSDSQVNLTQQTEANDFLAKRLGELQAEAIRIKAITEQLATLSGIDISSFQTPEAVMGGIETYGESFSDGELEQDMASLKQGFAEQRKQLTELQKLLLTQSSITSSIPSGKPAESGWVSSFYGNRIDPFTGKKAFHRGIDVAGKEGTGVIAVADGMVTWIGERGGYGGLVEVDHGNGYLTRYAHNKTIKVEVGDLVNKGQVIALMGSTGRSTGPHVHFEVLHNGKNVNPYNFLKK